MIGIVDLHSHILPYVDDGALRKEESDMLIGMLYSQGVRISCATPHLRKGMFETSDEDILKQFEKLEERTKASGNDIRMFLSREYHCDELFIEKLRQGKILPLGNSKALLIEFSQSHSIEDIEKYIKLVMDHGYAPVIAHIERYPVFKGQLDKVRQLADMGAYIQINAGSILGREGMRRAMRCRKLISEKAVHAVASDAHDPYDRPAELDRCYELIRKRYGEQTANELMYINPLKILGLLKGE